MYLLYFNILPDPHLSIYLYIYLFIYLGPVIGPEWVDQPDRGRVLRPQQPPDPVCKYIFKYKGTLNVISSKLHSNDSQGRVLFKLCKTKDDKLFLFHVCWILSLQAVLYLRNIISSAFLNVILHNNSEINTLCKR